MTPTRAITIAVVAAILALATWMGLRVYDSDDSVTLVPERSNDFAAPDAPTTAWKTTARREPSRTEPPRPHVANKTSGLARNKYPAADPAVPRMAMPRGNTQATCHITGTLRMSDGRPAANIDLAWRIDFGPQVFRGYASTDDTGRFHIHIEGVLEENTVGRLTLRRGKHHRPGTTSRDIPPKEVARANLPLDLPQGDFDLGVIVLRPLPLIAQGIVSDSDGQPLGQVRIAFEVRKRPGDPAPWSFDIKSDARTGSFEFRYETEAIEASVTFEKKGYLPQTFTFDVGKRDWHVTLRRSAGLRGRLLYDGNNARITVTTSDGVTLHDDLTTWRKRDGRLEFSFDRLAPGPAHIVIRVGGRVLLDKALDLRPGRIEAPPDLDDIPVH